ncbi:MAG: hypothetical protein ACRC33_31755 [Gemmataceae bacterium]
MADANDSLTQLRRGLLPLAPPAAPPGDGTESDALSVAGMDGRYATLRPANRNLTRLHVVKRDGKVFTFQYAFLDAASTFDGRAFTLLFAGARHWRVTVTGHGPSFWRAYDLVTLHRWPYLREATGSLPGADGEETAFLTIDVQDVTPQG